MGRALDAGLPGVLLRDKDLPPQEAYRHAEALRDAARARGAFFAVAARAELARELGADALHLGDGAPPPATEAWDGPLTVAAHDAAGLERAGRMGARFALLSPLFPTGTHPEASPLGPERFRSLAARSPVPVLALGGLTPENTPAALAAGASGVACIDAILAAEDPAAAVQAFLEVLES